MNGLLIFGVILIALGAFLLGVWSGPSVRDAWWTLDDKRRDLRRAAAAPYVPRHAPTLPRRKPLVNRQPWQTADMPAIRVPAAQLAPGPGDGFDEVDLARPYAPVPTDEETRELYCGGASREPAHREPPALNPLLAASTPAYGQVPVADVLEGERLAERVIA